MAEMKEGGDCQQTPHEERRTTCRPVIEQKTVWQRIYWWFRNSLGL
jgi:hypothetical protein